MENLDRQELLACNEDRILIKRNSKMDLVMTSIMQPNFWVAFETFGYLRPMNNRVSARLGSAITVAAKKAFEVFDIDKSGSISADEIVSILTKDTPAGKPLTLSEAKEIIDDFDKTGKGALNVSLALIDRHQTACLRMQWASPCQCHSSGI